MAQNRVFLQIHSEEKTHSTKEINTSCHTIEFSHFSITNLFVLECYQIGVVKIKRPVEMQKISFLINSTGPNHVIYTKTQLHGAKCTQLFIHILWIDWALLWALAADPELEAPRPCGALQSSHPPGTVGAIWEHPGAFIGQMPN